MNTYDVFLFGLIVRTSVFRLELERLSLDRYHEYKEKRTFFGGETGTAAIVLSSLGLSVKLTGNYLDKSLEEEFLTFFKSFDVDTSSIVFADRMDLMEDYVVITKNSRTIFGGLDAFFLHCQEEKRTPWNIPMEKEIATAKAAGIDPYFNVESRKAARYCTRYHVPYVTFDVQPDDILSRLASVIVLSAEYLNRDDSNPSFREKADVLHDYYRYSHALVIITDGSKEILYGRDGGVHTFSPFPISTVSTLGAGDTFRAACIYGLIQRWNDNKIVAFAAACAGIACTRFPIASAPPTLNEVEYLLKKETEDK